MTLAVASGKVGTVGIDRAGGADSAAGAGDGGNTGSIGADTGDSVKKVRI